MKQFEVGKSYSATSPCDHNCVWTFTVTRRTAKSLWLRGRDGETFRKGVKPSYDGREEVCYPLGVYSMCPVLGAE